MPENISHPRQHRPDYNPKARETHKKGQEPIDEQAAFAEQFFHDEQQYWADAYGENTDGPFRGGTTKQISHPAPKPKPKPAPVNNPK